MQRNVDLKKKLARLQKARRDIENHLVGGRVIREWKAFDRLTDLEKAQKYQPWDSYYEDVRQGVIYAMFQEQKKAFEDGDMVKVKQLSSDIKEVYSSGEVVKKPNYTDPWEYSHGAWVRNYRGIEKDIELTLEQLEYSESAGSDVSEIFGTQ